MNIYSDLFGYVMFMQSAIFINVMSLHKSTNSCEVFSALLTQTGMEPSRQFRRMEEKGE